jgi:hypothetical protein
MQSAQAESNIKTMIQLLTTTSWRFEVSNQAGSDLNVQKWNKITLVPLASDLKILKNYLTKKANEAKIKLISSWNDDTVYNDLLGVVFCQVLLLNRKRPG